MTCSGRSYAPETSFSSIQTPSSKSFDYAQWTIKVRVKLSVAGVEAIINMDSSTPGIRITEAQFVRVPWPSSEYPARRRFETLLRSSHTRLEPHSTLGYDLRTSIVSCH